MVCLMIIYNFFGEQKMKREVQQFVNVLKRIFFANMHGEHYWFIVQPVFVRIEKKPAAKKL